MVTGTDIELIVTKIYFMKKIMYVLTLGLGMSLFTTNIQAQTVVTRSHKAKSTAIGAGLGAITGAVISRDKSKGAIIGGVAGAAGGYAVGAHKDRKYGRKRVVKD